MQDISWSDFLIILISGGVLGAFLMTHVVMHGFIPIHHTMNNEMMDMSDE